jgi:CPA1 family monovalent cation:H+ antiporter
MTRATFNCTHLTELPEVDVAATTPEGCQECIAMNNDIWVHLRLCLSCGHVGCCDSSPYQHASAHNHDTKHPVMRSFEPGETWRWCYVDRRLV